MKRYVGSEDSMFVAHPREEEKQVRGESEISNDVKVVETVVPLDQVVDVVDGVVVAEVVQKLVGEDVVSGSVKKVVTLVNSVVAASASVNEFPRNRNNQNDVSPFRGSDDGRL